MLDGPCTGRPARHCGNCKREILYVADQPGLHDECVVCAEPFNLTGRAHRLTCGPRCRTYLARLRNDTTLL